MAQLETAAMALSGILLMVPAAAAVLLVLDHNPAGTVVYMVEEVVAVMPLVRSLGSVGQVHRELL